MKRAFGEQLRLENQNNQINGAQNLKPKDAKRAIEQSSPQNKENTSKGKRPKSDLEVETKKPHENVSSSLVTTVRQGSSTRTIDSGIEEMSLRENSNRSNHAKIDVFFEANSQLPKRQINLCGIDFSKPSTYYRGPDGIPKGVEDFDLSQIKDLTSEPHYAYDVFEYFREREVECQVKKYIQKQPELSRTMRAVLVDWMVEVQESFELNHETLYLAVKLVDHYLMKKVVSKNKFQLLGATCLLIAAKFDERIAPAIEDFLYICDDAYKRRDIILTEMDVLRNLNFFIGYPISYRFLRRIARCAKLSMETLTLARYILETSLMDYELIEERDSKLAAAALLLSLKMTQSSWSPSLAFYSKYEEFELYNLMNKLNDLISAPPKPTLRTIKTKYSHRIFYEVAKILPLSGQSL